MVVGEEEGNREWVCRKARERERGDRFSTVSEMKSFPDSL